MTGFKGRPFTDRPFAAGSLMGMRAWIIADNWASHGLLTGVYHRYPWTPDVNVATHWGPVPARGCDLISLDCLCGFYAYYDGSNDYLQDRVGWSDWRIAGIIEGWGRCVVGTRGFRCQRAQIQALVTPHGVDSETVQRIRNHYPDVPWFDTHAAAVAAFPLSVAELVPTVPADV